jgi:hypothetical protein
MSINYWKNLAQCRCNGVSCKGDDKHNIIHLRNNDLCTIGLLKLLYSLRHIQVIPTYIREHD